MSAGWENRWGDLFGAAPPGIRKWIGQARNGLTRVLSKERERWFLWLPVGVGGGVGVYFALPFEPDTDAAVLAAIVLAVIAPRLRQRPGWQVASIAALSVLAGFIAGSLRTDLVASPRLERETGLVTLVGRVVAGETLADGRVRYLLDPAEIGDMPPGSLPARVRVTAPSRDGDVARPGTIVRLPAVLMPPARPAAPGAFDYARYAYFQRIGGVGYAVSTAKPVAPEADLANLGAVERVIETVSETLAKTRAAMAAHTRAAIGGPEGAVAAALLTGLRGAIPAEVLEALRDSGLSHLLAISGLHMALFSGVVFMALRAAMALSPALALRYPTKKWAAIAALLAATAYLLLSGASIATQRAFVMVTLVFAAVLADRPAITMRNVAIAALIVLLWRPESLVQAGFQMSFAAAVALIAAYERASPGLIRAEADRKLHFGLPALVRVPLTYVAGILLTSLIAGLATAPFAAFHFNRVATMGLLGNLLAMPVMGLVIMPAAAAALILAPVGLDSPFLWLMGEGVGIVLAIARWVGGQPGAATLVPSAPDSALVLAVIGGLWLCLWRERWRWVGIVPMVAALGIAVSAPRPLILIDEEGGNLAVRTESGELLLRSPMRARRDVETWLRRDGDQRSLSQAAAGSAFQCDALGCRVDAQGRTVLFVHDPRALAEDCAAADILIASVPVRARCSGPEIVVDWFDLWRNGAHAITLGDRLAVTNVEKERGQRPWTVSPASAASGGR